MITAQRQRRRRRASTVIASLAAATGLVVGLAGPAFAATVTFGGLQGDSWGQVTGTVPDDSDDGVADVNVEAGLFDLTIDADTAATGYCIDILTDIVSGTLDEIDWDTSGVADLHVIETILANYHPAGDGPAEYALTGSSADKAVATQAAIWHFSDGFVLDGATETGDGGPLDEATVLANYQTILDTVAARRSRASASRPSACRSRRLRRPKVSPAAGWPLHGQHECCHSHAHPVGRCEPAQRGRLAVHRRGRRRHPGVAEIRR